MFVSLQLFEGILEGDGASFILPLDGLYFGLSAAHFQLRYSDDSRAYRFILSDVLIKAL